MRMPRRLALLAALVLAPIVAEAQPRPQKLGEFQSWTAASFAEGGQKTCYAFARPSKSEPARKDVLLTVTHRQAARDTVTISAGYAFPRNAEATVTVSGNDLNFYTAGSTAAARDGGMVVSAMRSGREMLLRGPVTNGRAASSDTFSLSGFTAAYEAISKECPPGNRR